MYKYIVTWCYLGAPNTMNHIEYIESYITEYDLLHKKVLEYLKMKYRWGDFDINIKPYNDIKFITI